VPVAKVAITLSPDLLERVDAQAASAGQSRSAFIQASLEQTLAAREEELAVREARAIYQAIEGDPELRRMHESFAAAAVESLPPFNATEVPPMRRRGSEG
jgi:metal-responsive CopG/Arc/MetJ family transcriptional regulator